MSLTGTDARYDFLHSIGTLPRMVQEALKLHGTREQPGPGNNPVIIEWAKELAMPAVTRIYTHDSVPWCGLFMGIIAKRAGKVPVADPLWALNWGRFGVAAGQPMLGDVLTFIRNGGGHVALYIAESRTTFHVLGGNQSDRVSFTEIAKDRLRAVRRPAYVNPPASARPYLVGASGKVSVNEA